MNFFWLLRMRRWVQHPPSWGRVKLVLAVVAICLALYAIERWIGWPDALNLQPGGPRMRPLH
ncbi:MAG: hypothetical protein P1U75_17425 [Antarcticimicrobium sp.]|uniref:hypothetical protein n=1 Tax=Antarcticimicrobium sp. TaxID=2824147 RepID=UPI0026288829|nr:hypothetical protein [Antarcticimicrobium sp.]MDF1718430.1 hypothetical protein [Antarcticimicrobium sp.]